MKKINFKLPFKLNKTIVLYSLTGIITLGLVIPMVTWALNDITTEASDVTGEIIATKYARKEYLVNEEFVPTGLSFKYKNIEKEVTLDDLTYDFSTAGYKTVNYTYNAGDYIYHASYNVEVYRATNLEVSNYSNIVIKPDGTVKAPDIKVVANLSGPANEFEKDSRYPGFDSTAFILNEHQYKITATKSSIDKYYNISLTAGGTTFGWLYCSQYEIPDCSSTDRLVTFQNMSGNNLKLELFVNYSSTAFTGLGVGKNTDVSGTYLLFEGETPRNTYHFKYRIETWTSNFLSESTYHEGLREDLGYGTDGACLRVEIGETTFVAPGTSWHLGVLGGN